MSDQTTTYDVRVRWTVENARSSEALLKRIADNTDKLAKSAKTADQNMGQMGGQFRALAGMAAGAFGIGKLKNAFFDFNASLDQTKIGMSAMLQMNIGGTWDDASARSKALVSSFQQIAKASVGTTEDFTNFSAAIMSSVLGANNGLKDTAGRIEQLKRITAGGVVAATVLGERPDIATLDIEQWLAGTLSAKDRFSKKLLAPMGLSHTQLNAKSQKERLKLLEQALTSPAIKNATKAYENSWAGVSSTMEDTLKMMAGSAGLPLFKAVTEEVKSWNKWISDNPAKIQEFANAFSQGLKDGFGMAKEVMGLLWRNREMLMMLAKAVLISKGVGMVGKLVAGPIQAIGQFAGQIGSLSKPLGDAGGGLTGFASKLGTAAAALGVLAGAAQFFADWVLNRQEADIAKRTNQAPVLARTQVLNYGKNGLQDEVNGLMKFKGYTRGGAENQARQRVLEQLQTAGIITKGGQINSGKVGAMFGEGKATTRYALDFARNNPGAKEGDRGMTASRQFYVNLIKLLEDDRRAREGQNNGFLDKLALQAFGVSLGERMAFGISGAGIMAVAAKMGAPLTLDQGAPKPVKQTVTINKIEVTSDDPDRFIIGVMEVVDEAVRNPSVARGTVRR
jgi:hypothetical protein